MLITGGSRGLGLIIARQLAEEGAEVVICARDEEELAAADKDLKQYGNKHLTVKCDITKPQEVRRMIEKIRKKKGDVEILINNAGIIQTGPMETMETEDYQKAMDVHFWGPFHTTNEVLRGMMKRQSGRIVNIISINGKVSFPHLLPYTVSKYALSGYSEGSSTELAKHNIRVTSVYPGLMRTGSPRNIEVKGQHQKEYGWFKVSDSLPGLSMSAESAAKKVINALKAGDKVLTIGIPTKLAVALEGIAPGLNLSVFDLANKYLPNAEGIGKMVKKGFESESPLTTSKITKKTQKAAEKNNEK